ncbi:hypothetical protein B566_EDAN015858 [Ephemera danica]|nr:hypothetical protein B566_EDAN015858 [Ephemera danica]
MVSVLQLTAMFSEIVLLSVLATVAISDIVPGNCPDLPAALNFNSTAFAGVWFDQAHTKRDSGLKIKCDLVRFASPSHDKLTFSSFSYSSATKQIISVSGTADVISSTGKLQVNIPSRNLRGEVRILSTDYTTFAVLWSCANAAGTHEDRSLVLTRDKHPSSALLNAATKVLENNNISKKDLSVATQHKCHEYDINANGLSNSLSHVTSMGALISVHDTATTTTSTTAATTTTSAINRRTTSRVDGIANQAQKVWSSITG